MISSELLPLIFPRFALLHDSAIFVPGTSLRISAKCAACCGRAVCSSRRVAATAGRTAAASRQIVSPPPPAVA